MTNIGYNKFFLHQAQYVDQSVEVWIVIEFKDGPSLLKEITLPEKGDKIIVTVQYYLNDTKLAKLNLRMSDYNKYYSYKPSLSFHIEGDYVDASTELATKGTTSSTTRTTKLSTYEASTETTEENITEYENNITSGHNTGQSDEYVILITLTTLCFIT